MPLERAEAVIDVPANMPRLEAGEPDALPRAISLSEHFRERLGEERFLVTQRVSWLLLSQSFLFLAYTALTVARPIPAKGQQATRLYHVIPLLGIVIVSAVYASIVAALLTSRALRRQFAALELEGDNPFDSIPTSALRVLGDVAVHLPPLAIGVTWIWLFITGESG